MPVLAYIPKPEIDRVCAAVNDRHARAALFADKPAAVATYFDANIDGLSSRLFDGNAWMQGSVAVPGDDHSLRYETAAHGMDVILTYGDVDIFATWFRDTGLR